MGRICKQEFWSKTFNEIVWLTFHSPTFYVCVRIIEGRVSRGKKESTLRLNEIIHEASDFVGILKVLTLTECTHCTNTSAWVHRWISFTFADRSFKRDRCAACTWCTYSHNDRLNCWDAFAIANNGKKERHISRAMKTLFICCFFFSIFVLNLFCSH